MNSSVKMKFSNLKDKAMAKLLIIILSVFLVDGCKTLSMTKTDNIDVRNNSELALDMLVNHNYPDTTFQNAELNSYITPKDTGSLVLVNREWEEYLKEKEKITIFFAERMTDDFYESGRQGQQHVYGKLILSQAKLDSLGGEIVFPDDVNQNGM